MKRETVRTSDLVKVVAEVHNLMDVEPGAPGMALLDGPPGFGKTTSLTFCVTRMRGVYIRAMVTWSVTSMLQSLCRELDLPAHRHRQPMIDAAIQSLATDPRPVFIDEADYLFRQRGGETAMLDALRDVYDTAGVPVILVGMETLAQELRTPRLARFDRRMARIRMEGLSEADAQTVAEELCEVPIDRDVVAGLHGETGGNIGRLVVALGQLERWSRTNGLPTITLDRVEQNGPIPRLRAA